MKLQVRARSLDSSDGSKVYDQRLLAEFDVTDEAPRDFECMVELYSHEAPVLYFANAPLDSDREDKDELRKVFQQMLDRSTKLRAAWLKLEKTRGIRGGVGWERVKSVRDSGELDLSTVDMSKKAVDALLKEMVRDTTLYVETASYHFFEEGPSLELHGLEIEGPIEILPSSAQPEIRKTVDRVFGKTNAVDDRERIGKMLEHFLTKTFRRPATDAHVQAYSALVFDHAAEGHSLDAGLHLAIRTALMSPEFLYRGHTAGRLDDFDLASRLSYFLTSGPPDEKLFAAAANGTLSRRNVLEAQTRRLLKAKSTRAKFVGDFTGQWLSTRSLVDIMPDARLLEFDDRIRQGMIEEVEAFFTEILHENLPLETFIRPDFTFMNKWVAPAIYGRKKITQATQRVKLKADEPYGGILGLPAVMMATANGVDTQPVVRGVWVLENVLGDPPPPPPESVPAITPDTRGSKTVRDLLSAHRADQSCAVCHKRIDPIGFVMENFDPVGRWRTHYPKYSTNSDGDPITKEGPAIDAASEFPGATFRNIDDLRDYVVDNIDDFGSCLSQKLLTYACGRSVSYAEKQEIRAIVTDVKKRGNGFQDLLVELVQSRTFATK